MLRNWLTCGLLSLTALNLAWAQGGPSVWDKLRQDWREEAKSIKDDDLTGLKERAASCDAKATYLLGSLLDEKRLGLVDPALARQVHGWSLCAAENGNPILMKAVCWNFTYGIGVAKNEATALLWCKRAADMGLSSAMGNLGHIYAAGLGITSDPEEAARWYRRGAEGGDTWSMGALAAALRDGKGVVKDDAVAMHWFRKAAEAGHSPSMGSVGWMYAMGRGVVQDEVEAVRWYRKAAEAGDPWSMNALAFALRDGKGVVKDEVAAMHWFRKAAEAGYVEAMTALGAMNFLRLKDYKEAMHWFQSAEEKGSIRSRAWIGLAHLKGSGVRQDSAEAARWFRLSADAGDGWAMDHLASLMRNGDGVERNYEQALQWYRKSVEAGQIEALSRLGDMYWHGQGVNEDKSEAWRSYQRGASAGDGISMIRLSENLLSGAYVPKDVNAAARWLAKAQRSTSDSKFRSNGETGAQRAKRMLDELLASGEVTDPQVLQEVRATARPAPTVQWARLEAQTAKESSELRVRLQDTGGGIGRVELWLNGAVVGQFAPLDEGRGLVPPTAPLNDTPGSPGGAGREWAYTLRVSSGQHQLEVRAYNGESLVNFNTLKATLRSTYEPPRKPRLYAVVVGVDDYENSSLKLTYAGADAHAVAALLKSQLQGSGLYSGGEVVLLTSKAQTAKGAISSAVRAFHGGQRVRADDVFVFYAAAHGWYDTTQSRYHMLTSDVLHLSTDRLAGTAIGDEELRDLIRNVPAQKKLVMLDTCNSGGFARLGAQDLVASRSGLGEQEIINYMQNRTGATVFAASGSQEVAREGYQGHGVFSYFLLEGLKGAAARPGQALVSSDDLKIYVEEQVPQVMARKGWGKQAPLIAVQGQGFPVVMKQ